MTEPLASLSEVSRPSEPGRAPRLLIVTGLDIRAYRGGEKYAVKLGQALERRGVEVRLLSKVDRNLVHRLRDEELAQVVGLPLEFYHPRLLPLLPPLVPDFWRVVRAVRWADSVYAFEATPRLLSMLLWTCRWVGRRFVVGLHSPTLLAEIDPAAGGVYVSRWWRRELAFVWRNADAVHALTPQQAAGLRTRGLAPGLVVVPSFPTLGPPSGPPGTGEPFEVLFVGPLEREQKGVDLLVDIGRRALNDSSGARLTIVGSGPAQALVEALASEFPGRVRLLGFVPESALADLYARAHVVLLPSRAEALPMVALEALSLGVPVLGFEVPGLAQISSVYPEGRVPAFDVEEFARKIRQLEALRHTRPEEYAALRARLRAASAGEYGVEAVIPQLERMLGLRAAASAP